MPLILAFFLLFAPLPPNVVVTAKADGSTIGLAVILIQMTGQDAPVSVTITLDQPAHLRERPAACTDDRTCDVGPIPLTLVFLFDALPCDTPVVFRVSLNGEPATEGTVSGPCAPRHTVYLPLL